MGFVDFLAQEFLFSGTICQFCHLQKNSFFPSKKNPGLVTFVKRNASKFESRKMEDADLAALVVAVAVAVVDDVTDVVVVGCSNGPSELLRHRNLMRRTIRMNLHLLPHALHIFLLSLSHSLSLSLSLSPTLTLSLTHSHSLSHTLFFFCVVKTLRNIFLKYFLM